VKDKPIKQQKKSAKPDDYDMPVLVKTSNINASAGISTRTASARLTGVMP